MTAQSIPAIPANTALTQAERDLITQDRCIVRAQAFHRGLLRGAMTGAIVFAASMAAALFGIGNALTTALHTNDATAHGHTWPLAQVPSWTVAKAGLGGAAGGMVLMFGFAAGANTQARRIGAMGEKRYQLYLAHEDARMAFNAQAERPKAPQYVPADIRTTAPMILRAPKLSFTSSR